MPRDIDWSPIEADYRIGKMSVKAIAAKHGVAYSGVRRRAEEHGWTQDLTPVVQAATRAELTKQAQQRAAKPKPDPKPEQPATEKPSDASVVADAMGKEVRVITSAIDAAVAENVHVINRHRKTADSLMRLVELLAEEVNTLTNGNNHPERGEITLGDRVDAVRKLSQTVATVVDVERRAHNLDDKTTDDDSLAALIRSIQGSSLPIVVNDPEADE